MHPIWGFKCVYLFRVTPYKRAAFLNRELILQCSTRAHTHTHTHTEAILRDGLLCAYMFAQLWNPVNVFHASHIILDTHADAFASCQHALHRWAVCMMAALLL